MTTYRILSKTLGVVVSEREADTPLEALGDLARAHGFDSYYDMLVKVPIDPTLVEVRALRGDATDEDDLIRCTCCGGLFYLDHPMAQYTSEDGEHFSAHCPLCVRMGPNYRKEAARG